MKENQKDKLVPDNQDSPKNQESQSKDNSKKSDKTPQKPAKNEGDNITTGARKEHDDKEHQHDYKTPTAGQKSQSENQSKTKTTISEVHKNQGVYYGAE